MLPLSSIDKRYLPSCHSLAGTRDRALSLPLIPYHIPPSLNHNSAVWTCCVVTKANLFLLTDIFAYSAISSMAYLLITSSLSLSHLRDRFLCLCEDLVFASSIYFSPNSSCLFTSHCSPTYVVIMQSRYEN